MRPLDLLRLAYEPLLALAVELDEQTGWTPTRLPGWVVRDLVLHLASDAQRALVALATPASGPCDTDEVDYWRSWTPGTDGARDGLRGTRIQASAWTSARGPADLFTETARAVLVAGGRCDDADAVTTQGRTLTVGALLHTLAVEATIHHLDLEPVLTSRPDDRALAAVRQVLDGLLGRPAPAEWDGVRYALVGTGRARADPAERAALGDLADRLPLFG